MIRKAKLKRAFAGVLAAILVLSTTPIAYAATTPGVEVVDELSTVTIHVFDNNNSEPQTAGSGEELPDTGSLGTAIEGATLSYCKIGKLVQYTTGGSTSLKYAVSKDDVGRLKLKTPSASSIYIGEDSYYLCDAAALQDLIDRKTSSDIREAAQNPDMPEFELQSAGPTNGQGTVEVGSLSGLYLFIGNTMPEGVTTEVAPFFVSAPLPADGSWNTNIHVYPKVQTAGKISISKTVNDAESMSANSGTSLNYKIVATIPAEAKNFDSFEIEDELPVGLSVDDSASVSTSDGVTIPSNGYQLSSDDGKISFSLIDSGLDAFDQAGGCTLTISYGAHIDQDAALAAPITNTAHLTYTYVGGAESEASDSATVYTYGIDLTKTFEDAGNYPGDAHFSLYTDQQCTDVIKVNGTSGAYWVDENGSSGDMTVAQLGATQNGTLTVKGLAAGTYYLKETQAPTSYGKIEGPVKIVISKGTKYDALNENIENPMATVNDAEATISAGGADDKPGLVQLIVENQKLLFGFLPKTGDVGTFIFIAAGIGLVCAAVAYLASRRRKGMTNSH